MSTVLTKPDQALINRSNEIKCPLRAVVLAGPTASGKTQLALALARHFPVPIQIISMDSALVYKGMDIGTAKPDWVERSICPHHLIDILTPLEAYSAAQFLEAANQLIRQICQQGHLPVLVGGTMMYYKTLIDGLSDLPAADAALREQILQEAHQLGWPAMHEKLKVLDPHTAQRLNPNDAQRIHRALEICQLSGKTMTALLAQRQRPTQDIAFLSLALVPSPRAMLHEQIAQRFHLLLENGFIEEVRRLRQCYPELTADHPAMRCVGYRQIWSFLEGECTENQMYEAAVAATRQLAKRQLTWIKGLDMMSVLVPADNVLDQVSQRIATFLSEV